MKYTLLSALLVPLFILPACERDNQSDVANYVSLLRSNQYSGFFLPDFEPDDIPALLSYAGDTSTINHFPVNPISSRIYMPVKVGIVVLWTIESVRVSELRGDTSEFQRFPSLGPAIGRKSTGEVFPADLTRVQDSVLTLYQDWWNDNSHSLSDKMQVNPLDKSVYVWD